MPWHIASLSRVATPRRNLRKSQLSLTICPHKRPQCWQTHLDYWGTGLLSEEERHELFTKASNREVWAQGQSEQQIQGYWQLVAAERGHDTLHFVAEHPFAPNTHYIVVDRTALWLREKGLGRYYESLHTLPEERSALAPYTFEFSTGQQPDTSAPRLEGQLQIKCSYVEYNRADCSYVSAERPIIAHRFEFSAEGVGGIDPHLTDLRIVFSEPDQEPTLEQHAGPLNVQQGICRYDPNLSTTRLPPDGEGQREKTYNITVYAEDIAGNISQTQSTTWSRSQCSTEHYQSPEDQSNEVSIFEGCSGHQAYTVTLYFLLAFLLATRLRRQHLS